ncbi:unnamed protein product, partial [Enterobius vermicularis]|uniref:SAP domain-containing protein n=1 Tax=Enterobius vermicularis TaxID=51028 RepID=A0A0N4VPF0_ENTVE
MTNQLRIGQTKAEVLKRCKLKDSLNRKLQRRPGPLELVTKKILQADAELELAIQGLLIGLCFISLVFIFNCNKAVKGRVLFTKTTEFGVEGERDDLPHQTPGMEVIATPTCSHQPKVVNICNSKSRFRKKAHQNRTPYEQSSSASSPNQTRSKIKLQDNKEATADNSYKVSSLKTVDTTVLQPRSPNETAEQFDAVCESHSSYDLLLHQQHLFLQWQREVENSDATSSSQQDDSSRQNSNELPCVVVPPQTSLQPEVNYQLTGEYQESSSYQNTISPTVAAEVAHSTVSTSLVDGERPKTKLSDYRVQDLKNECKKRQLPVSGPKPHLIERLKPYEDDILNNSNALNIQELTVDSVIAPSPASDTSTGSNRLPPISNVINDYIQQNVSQHPITVAQQQPVLVQIPTASQQQVLHLVDSNGAIIANTAVPSNMQCYCISSDYGTSTDSTVGGTRIMAADQLRSEGSQSTTVQYVSSQPQPVVSAAEPTFSFAQLGSGGQFTLVQASSSTDFQPRSTTAEVSQSSTQCVQTGSQQIVHVCSQLQPASGAAQQTQQGQPLQSVSTTTIPIVSTNGCHFGRSVLAKAVGQQSQTVTITPGQTVQQQLHQQHQTQQIVAQPQIATTVAFSQKSHVPYVQYVLKTNGTQHVVHQEVTPVSQRALCPPMQAALPSAECSPIVADSASESSSVPSPQEAYNKATSQQDLHQIAVDPNDTSALLSATTLSIHEEMLRYQQRKIDELQKELHCSQQQLRHQQRVILAAKKAQQKKRQEAYQHEGNDDQKSQAEVWLRQLDISKLHKFHIQRFVQHKQQLQ